MANLQNTNILVKLDEWQYLLEQNTYRVKVKIVTDVSEADLQNRTLAFTVNNSSDQLFHSKTANPGKFLTYDFDSNGECVMEILVPDTNNSYQVNIHARVVVDTGTTEEQTFPYLDVDGVLQTDVRVEKVYETSVLDSSTITLETNSWS